jgi:hypothetical protein
MVGGAAGTSATSGGEVLNLTVVNNIDGDRVATSMEKYKKRELIRSGGMPCARCH